MQVLGITCIENLYHCSLFGFDTACLVVQISLRTSTTGAAATSGVVRHRPVEPPSDQEHDASQENPNDNVSGHDNSSLANTRTE